MGGRGERRPKFRIKRLIKRKYIKEKNKNLKFRICNLEFRILKFEIQNLKNQSEKIVLIMGEISRNDVGIPPEVKLILITKNRRNVGVISRNCLGIPPEVNTDFDNEK